MSVKSLTTTVVRHRRTLHQIPELAFDLFKTHAYVKDILVSLGYEIEVLAQTGIVAVKRGTTKDFVAFRSDMDALPVTEQTGVEFASTHPGAMHACGHDGHMSMLLGFAEYISTKTIEQSVLLIFQPAEEGPGGAKVMIEEGLFERYDIKRIYGFHVYPELEEGVVGLVDGPMMPQNAEFDLVVRGRSAHGAQPHKGIDAIVAASQFVQTTQTIVSRTTHSHQSAVVTIGTIEGGEARNIIAGSVSMSGTIRAFDPPTYELIKQRLREIAKGIEQTFGVTIELDIVDYYPPVINDSILVKEVSSLFQLNESQMIEPMMFSEDFAFYQQHVPGCFMMLGTKNEAKGFTAPLHNNQFNFTDEVLLQGVEAYRRIAAFNNIIKEAI
jgi:amidohydrolase